MPFVDSGGVRLYAEETGSGHALVWLHEFAADYRTWEGQVRRFSRYYRCITYNARGYPPSDVPQEGAHYSYEHEREDLRAVLDSFGVDRAHIVGLSMGAYTGLQFAMKYPERVTALVFASGGSGSARANREGMKRDTEEGAARMLRDGMEAAANGLALGPSRIQLLNKDPRGWEEFRGYMAEHSALGSALTLRNFQTLRPSLYDYETNLRELDVPVMLAAGDEDDAVIEASIFLKRALPKAGLWIHPQSGHGLNLEEPDAFNGMVAWFFAAVERGGWRRRDPRANPNQSGFMGDKPAKHS
jgi:pimeloyl-ACP methyl ester carboxylesterase